MASKVSNLLKIIGRKAPGIGSTIYHVADGVAGGGYFDKNKRHRLRMALARQRLRPSGMTDDLLGSKEVGGTQENPYEED